QIDSDVGSVLSEHLRIRRHLRIISHRYRAFIICCLILITGSQFTSLLITTKATSALNFYKAGELAIPMHRVTRDRRLETRLLQCQHEHNSSICVELLDDIGLFHSWLMTVTYFENNRAGITIYGFVLDRSTLHTIFGLELSLVLWLLGKTIVSL
ncbi:hypothetical protein Goari_001111, partial [Gossypium aridum]|nr:hypothetical protein [Gossypium aridum]